MPAAFPFDTLPRVTRSEVHEFRRAMRALLPVRPDRSAREVWAGTFLRVFGEPIEAIPGEIARVHREAARARHGDVALGATFHHAQLGCIALLVDRTVAITLAARALGSTPDDALAFATERVLRPAHEGALALLLAQAAVRWSAPSPPPILRGVTDEIDDVLDAVGTELVVWTWRVTGRTVGGDVALLIDASRLREPSRTGPLPRATAAMKLGGELIACRDVLRHETLAQLARGDVLVSTGPVRLASDGATVAGAAILAFGPIDVPVTLDVDRCVVAGEAIWRSRVTNDDDADETNAVGNEQVRAIPVEVEAVIARASVSVGEIAAWRVGEVVTLDGRIGDAVMLRAGGRPFARGELCDVEGSVGVRIAELL